MNNLELPKFELENKIEYTLPTVKVDLKEAKTKAEIIAKKYKDVIIQEEDVAAAKKIRAELNKVNKELDKQRKNIISEMNKPIKDLKSEVDSVISIIKEASDSLDKQVKDFEDKEKLEKEKAIKELPNYKEFISIDNKWLAKAKSLKSISAEIDSILEEYEKDLKTLRILLNGQLEEEKYVKALQNGKNLNEINEIIENDLSIKEKYASEPTEPTPLSIFETSITYTRKLTIKATAGKLKALKEFMVKNNIEYEVE